MEGSSPPASRAAPRAWPPRLRLLAASPEELRFVGWWPAGAPLVLTPVILALASSSWLAPVPLTATRLLVSLLALGVALSLIARHRPRRVEIVLRPRARQLLAARRSESLPEVPVWRLVSELPASESPQPEYAALLVDGERHWRLLDSDDPAQLLREFQRVLACWPGSVEQTWGLPSGVQPWRFDPAPGPARTGRVPLGSKRVLGATTEAGLRWAMLVTTGLVLIDLSYLVLSAGAQVPSVHPLSLVLPAIGAICLVTITLAVLTRRPRLLLGKEWVQESSVLGLCRARQRIPSESVRGVYPLTAGSEEQLHLLIDGSAGPLALLVPGREAEQLRARLASELARAPLAEPLASESTPSAPRRWRSG